MVLLVLGTEDPDPFICAILEFAIAWHSITCVHHLTTKVVFRTLEELGVGVE